MSHTTQLRVGRLTKAHGLKGAIKIELYTDSPERRFVPGAVFSLQVPAESPWHEKTLTLAELKWFNQQPVAFFVDVSDRTTAESLLKAILWVDQNLNEPSDEEDAWFDHQLVGLAVVRDGTVIGKVAQVDHLPAQDLLHIETPSGTVMVPFVKAIVPSVDIEAGTLTVTPPMGLFEEIADEEADDASAAAASGVEMGDPAAAESAASDTAASDTVASGTAASDPAASDPAASDEP